MKLTTFVVVTAMVCVALPPPEVAEDGPILEKRGWRFKMFDGGNRARGSMANRAYFS